MNSVIITERRAIKIWGDEPEEGSLTRQQFLNLANLPIAEKWVCAMPDYHQGYGMPIGGVLATKGGVVPNAVGVDIGCGMVAVKTHLNAGQFTNEDLEAIRRDIHAQVPVGMNHHEKEVENWPLILGSGAAFVTTKQLSRAKHQIGTLGGGNHFIELQSDLDGYLWVMIHSGSRNVGKQVCDHYHGIAKQYMKDFHSNVPDLDLAFLPQTCPEYANYMDEMEWCMVFAEWSRQSMLDAVMWVLTNHVGHEVYIDEQIDTHHNFAAMENHYNQNLLIHRKGAVKAEGLVTIPGSMGTHSYIGLGLKPAESFNTCAHGAGRAMGRGAANRMMKGKHKEAVEMMQHVVFGVREGDYDELPFCYKDIDVVMKDMADLVEPVYKLLPLMVVKG